MYLTRPTQVSNVAMVREGEKGEIATTVHIIIKIHSYKQAIARIHNIGDFAVDVLGYGHKGRKTLGGETRITTADQLETQ